MGNEQSIVRNLDKRSARREYAGHFKAGISRFRQEYVEGGGLHGLEDGGPRRRDVRVCVRKRPFFQHEKEQGEYDVITAGQREVVIHDARMHSDMRHMFLNHHTFGFDAVFGETATNDDVYEDSAALIVQGVTRGLGVGTIMMYGQTGSGKTYTMSAIHERAAADLFRAVDSERDTEITVSVSFVELAGDTCRDVLYEGGHVQLLTGKNGDVQPYPIVEVQVRTCDELLTLVRFAANLRATEATGVHDQSSRSHAVCRIFVHRSDNNSESVLQLVDLAGTEHRIDSAEHDQARRKECAQINSSLAALKECVRLRASGAQFVPFRKCKLTHILKNAFSEGNTTVIIATISPASKDTEQSLNTLRHACIMDGQGPGESESGASHVTGGKAVREDLGEIDVTALARERKAKKAAGVETEGGWLPPPKQEELVSAKVLAKRVEKARAAAERRALKDLVPEMVKLLMDARQDVGSNKRQMARLQRYDGGGPGGIMEAIWKERMLAMPGEGPRTQSTVHEVCGEVCGGLQDNDAPFRAGMADVDDGRNEELQMGEGPRTRGLASPPPASDINTEESVKDRHREAARRRAEAENERKEEIKRKMELKDRRSSGGVARPLSGTSKGPTQNAGTSVEEKRRVSMAPGGLRCLAPVQLGSAAERDPDSLLLLREVEELQVQLQDKDLSQAKAFALKKKLATARAAMLKRERRIEEDRKRIQQQAAEIAAQQRAERESRAAQEEKDREVGPLPTWDDGIKENDASGMCRQGPGPRSAKTNAAKGKFKSGGVQKVLRTSPQLKGRAALARQKPAWQNLMSMDEEVCEARPGSRRGANEREKSVSDGRRGVWAPPPWQNIVDTLEEGSELRSGRDVAEHDALPTGAKESQGRRPGALGRDVAPRDKRGDDVSDSEMSKRLSIWRTRSEPGNRIGESAGESGRAGSRPGRGSVRSREDDEYWHTKQQQDTAPKMVQYGKGLEDGVVEMLEQDAMGFREVLEGRVLRRCLESWRKGADIAAMSRWGRA